MINKKLIIKLYKKGKSKRFIGIKLKCSRTYIQKVTRQLNKYNNQLSPFVITDSQK